MHAGQLTVTTEMVQDLVASQLPQWADLPIIEVSPTGTVNAIFRIGSSLAGRFPLRPADAAATRQWLEQEAEAARRLAGRTPFATPSPVFIGEPGHGFPLPWAVQSWIPGTVATSTNAMNSTPFARDLAQFVQAVRMIDTQGKTFAGTGRGGHLTSSDAWMKTCFARSQDLLDVAWLRTTWQAFRILPRFDNDVMTHGDLIPGNLLVESGRLTGVLDVGGLAPADPALDLVCAWHLLDSASRNTFRETLACDDLQWARGAAWAFIQAVGLVWYYANSNTEVSELGRLSLSRIADDFP